MNKDNTYKLTIKLNDEFLEDGVSNEELELIKSILPELIREILIQIEKEKE
ncbi:hypothetical protein [Mariprofundus sp. EBB-1]|uniref:hypothetical protein n=1 Tax=Mariprofundus sp. EBB-1 TaxID=2650971 RepID=UPI001292D2C2|nr:hypothetical protein [Mariprofundus sp. EBB-1]